MSHPPTIDNDAPRFTRGVHALVALMAALVLLQLTLFADGFSTRALGFSWAHRDHWWSFATYTLVHDDSVIPLLLSAYPLILFGPRMEQAWGTRRFLWFWVACGLGGVVFHALFAPAAASIIGASAAVFGLMTAYAMQWPDEDILLLGFIPVRVWPAVMVVVAITLAVGTLTSLTGGPSVTFLAHLGGMVAAWVYMRTPGSSNLDHLRHRVARAPDVDESPRVIPRTQPRSRERLEEVDEIVARSKALAARKPVAVQQQPHRREPRPEEVNRVLDKISAEGLESLTSEERTVLEEMAKRLKGS